METRKRTTKGTARARERVRVMSVNIFCYKSYGPVAVLIARSLYEIKPNRALETSPVV
jgi:hypothetical protein